MAELVNLNRFKKRGAKQQAAKQAEANRVRFGRTKSQRLEDKTRNDRADDVLDQHRIERGDKS